MKLEEKLGTNKYYVDETCPNIHIDDTGFNMAEKRNLTDLSS